MDVIEAASGETASLLSAEDDAVQNFERISSAGNSATSYRVTVEEVEDIELGGLPRRPWVGEYPEEAHIAAVLRHASTIFEELRDQRENTGLTNYVPFENREEWELAKWLITSGLSQEAINEYLTLPIVRQFDVTGCDSESLTFTYSRLALARKYPSKIGMGSSKRSTAFQEARSGCAMNGASCSCPSTTGGVSCNQGSLGCTLAERNRDRRCAKRVPSQGAGATLNS